MVRQDQTSVIGDGHSGTLRQRRACRYDLKPFQVQDRKHHRSDFPRLIDRWISEGKNGSSGESSDMIIANLEIPRLYRFVEPMRFGKIDSILDKRIASTKPHTGR